LTFWPKTIWPKRYDIVYADPPWSYYGSATKNAAAGKHYPLMELSELAALRVGQDLLSNPGALFLWATGPRLDFAFDLIRAWGLHYRGVAHVWVKTRKDGTPIHGQGIPPTYSKPTTELLLLATTKPRGRPFPLLDSALPQVVFAPRGKHSEKPAVFRDLIARGYGDRSRIELFARSHAPGWDAWGNEINAEELADSRSE